MGFVDQQMKKRFREVRAQILARQALFARQGSVVATWRSRAGRRFGPYFRVSYRECDGSGATQRCIYLGCSEALAQRVRELLEKLQARHRARRRRERLLAEARSDLARARRELRRTLAPLGVQVKGYDLRGAARAVRRYGNRPDAEARPDCRVPAAIHT